MATCKGNKGEVLRAARLYARNCEGLFTPICCLDNVALNFDNTERIRQETQDGCVVKDVRRLTAELTYDLYSLQNATALSLMFPNGALSQQGGAITGATQILSEGTWSSSTTVAKQYLIENRNTNNTAVTVTGIMASKEGVGGIPAALTAGSDYTITTQNLPMAGGGTYTVSYLNIPATHSISTDAQDLTITYNYTTTATYKFELPLGSYASGTLDIMMLAVNKADDTDIIKVFGEGSFNVSGSVFLFGDTDAEISGISASFQLEQDTQITIEGLSLNGNTCA